MAYILAPGIHTAQVGGCAIVLDTLADRYRRLSPALTAALSACLDANDAPDAPSRVQLLLQQRIIAEASQPVARSALSIVPPVASVVDASGEVADVAWSAAARALAGARIRLRRAGLAQTLRVARGRASTASKDDRDAAAALARGLLRLRPWLPFRRACLPDSLALHALLCSRDVQSTLIIGVRDHPFNAHCWVQAGGLVLTDPVADIDALTPILSL